MVQVPNSGYQYQYNGKEWQDELGYNMYDMDMRQYDPAIARWVAQDPVEHLSMSPYNAFDNNPVFWADPSGADSWQYDWEANNGTYKNSKGETTKDWQRAVSETTGESDGDGKDDNITVNSKGIVTNIEINDQPNRFFDEKGNELFLNDANGVDNILLKDSFEKGERIYYALSTKEFVGHILETGQIPLGLPLTVRYIMAALKSHSEWDFAESYLVKLIDNPVINPHSGRREGNTTYYSESGYFRFGNTNYIYNLYDAGNYMWGAAMSLSGFSYPEVKAGSQTNSTITTQSLDTEADQNAIKNGYYGK